jgi:hypothetical protein
MLLAILFILKIYWERRIKSMENNVKRVAAMHGLSDQVRSVARTNYVEPAIRAGKKQFPVAVRDLMMDLRDQGFPPKNWPQICNALQTPKFLRENCLEIEGVDGPPSKMSSTVVVRYRVAGVTQPKPPSSVEASGPEDESHEERTHRLVERLRGKLKDEIAAFGGGEALIRWVRGYDEEEG